jgi:hypothetical protein
MTPQEIKPIIIREWFIENRPDVTPDEELLDSIYENAKEEIEPYTEYKMEELPYAAVSMYISEILTRNYGDSIWTRVTEVYYTDFEKDYEAFLKCGILYSEIEAIVNRIKEKGYNDDFSYINDNDEVARIDDEELREIIYNEILIYSQPD